MKTLLVSLIRIIDKLVVSLAGWHHIPHSRVKLLYLVPHKFKGSPITLRDGTRVSSGDIVAELHIDNRNIRSFEMTYTNILNSLREEMKALKESIGKGTCTEIKAVFGMTVFHAMLKRQGFTVIVPHNPLKRAFASIWENLLRILLKKGGKTKRKYVGAMECWLSGSQIESFDIHEETEKLY